MRSDKAWVLVAMGLIGAFVIGLRVMHGSSSEPAPTRPAGMADASGFPADWFYFGGDPRQERLNRVLGEPFPELEVTEWKNGKPELEGKIVVFDFWATWCGPCLRAIPDTNEMAAEYADRGVEVVGVCTASEEPAYHDTVEGRDIEYPVAYDTDDTTARAWGVRFYPTYAVADRSGEVRAIGLRPDSVDKVIDRLLEEENAGESAERSPAQDDSAAEDTEGGDDATAGDASADAAARINPEWLDGDAQRREELASLVGGAPPALNVTDWYNTESSLDLESLKGKVVLLDFWATWCGPCLEQVPHHNELMDKYGEEGLVIIGVCDTQGAQHMHDVADDFDIAYPIAADVEQRTTEAYKTHRQLPAYYLIDRSGQLAAADVKTEHVEDAIRALLKEQAPAGQ